MVTIKYHLILIIIILAFSVFDRKIRGCEKLILTKFIKNCRDNPPAGDQCDCMDQKNNQSPCRDPFEPQRVRGKNKGKTMKI
jgi:hypothetical protein